MKEFHRKSNRQRDWEEMERKSVVYRPRPRTVPIVRCSTPTPPPESPKKAPVNGDDAPRSTSFPALLLCQSSESRAPKSAETASASPSTGQPRHPKRNHEGDLIVDGADVVVSEGRRKPQIKAIDSLEESDKGGGIDLRPVKRSKKE